MDIAAPALCPSLNAPASADRTLAAAKRRQGDVYRQRALHALTQALRRWCIVHLGEAPRAGIDLAPLMAGKVRYWETGGPLGWLRISGTGGRSGDCGARVGCSAVLTEAGLVAAQETAGEAWWWPRQP